jgi:3-oxoacyl-[acyl-carrier-protein] synthase II
MEDTGMFLNRLLEQDEQLLSPTPFIQSTHNTVSSQIALLLNCHQYNNTFVHRGFSFESALLDAMMLLQENEISTVLAGSIDEITEISHLILSRLGLYKRVPVPNTQLLSSGSKGTIAGEGAAFFLLANQPSANDYATLDGMATFYKPDDLKETEYQITSFLSSQSINVADVDLIITGKNGDLKNDEYYNHLNDDLFKNNAVINYKHLCGEYPTSTSFALWLAANIAKRGQVPVATGYNVPDKNKLKRMLIYNNYFNIHHSLLLISAT